MLEALTREGTHMQEDRWIYSQEKNTMLSTMSLERRSNKIIIICTCTIVPPLVQELPEGF